MIGCLTLANQEYSHQQLELTSSMFVSADADVFNQDLETAHSNEMILLEDQRSYKIMKKSFRLVDDHYKLPLLWRSLDQDLPNNKWIALRRLKSLGKKMKRDPTLKKKYMEQVELMLEKGYAERIDEEDDADMRALKDSKIWHVPHHSVVNSRKPEKLRIVFDCGAEHRGLPLNKVLMQGPDLVNRLVGVLTRFRKYPVALVADIEAMFHQVKVRPADRNNLRLLW